MDRILAPYRDTIYALLRGAAGFLFLCHGAQKVLGMLGGFGGTGDPAPFGLLWLAGLIELVGGTLVLIGLFTSWTAFICSGQMAVAYFMAHQFGDRHEGLLPIQNQGELAALYAWLFLYIAARGSGPISVDAARSAPADARSAATT